MDASARTALEERLESLVVDIAWAADFRAALERDLFEVTHVRRAAGRSWLIRAKPPKNIQETFGLAPELLFVVVAGEVEARDLQRAKDEVLRSGLRLDGNLLIVADSGASTLKDRLERIPGQEQRVAWIPNTARRWPSLPKLLGQQLPTYDVFEDRDPVRGYQLMGRYAEVMELRTRVLRGDAVGVFGLRKMGKTSLVRAVTDALDPASGTRDPHKQESPSQACVIWIDAEVLDERSVNAVADEMTASLRRRMNTAEVPFEAPTQTGTAGLKVACEKLLESGTRLLFVVDEYDLLFEGEGGEGAIPGLSRLFRLLRAWAQIWQGTVSLVLIGRDPEHLSTPQLDGISNPLLAWFKPMWLGPLAPPQDTELLRKLGRRVGLDIGYRSAELARQWTGGHPMLHRQFGSALREQTRTLPRPQVSEAKTPTDPYCDTAVPRFVQRGAVLEIQREIIDLLRKRYRDAFDLVRILATTPATGNSQAKAGGLNRMLEGPGGRVLRSFGLLDEGGTTLPEHLASYVRNLLPDSDRVAV